MRTATSFSGPFAFFMLVVSQLYAGSRRGVKNSKRRRKQEAPRIVGIRGARKKLALRPQPLLRYEHLVLLQYFLEFLALSQVVDVGVLPQAVVVVETLGESGIEFVQTVVGISHE